MKGAGPVLSFICVAAKLQAALFSTNSFTRTDVSLPSAPLDVAAAPGFVAVGQTNGILVFRIEAGSGAAAAMANLSATNVVDSVALGDLNGDGTVDVIGGVNGAVLVYTNLTDGVGQRFALGAFGFNKGIRAVDFDGDGKLDLATALDGFYVARNESTAGNLAFATAVRVALPYDFQLGDLDGDGRMDLVSATNWLGSPTVFYALNSSSPGNISFATVASNRFSGLTLSGADLNLAVDFDRDGRSDVVSVGFGFSQFAFNDPYRYQTRPGFIGFSKSMGAAGAVTFGPAVRVEADLPLELSGLKARALLAPMSVRSVCADLDGDGRLDFAFGGVATNRLTLVRNASVSFDNSLQSLEPVVEIPAGTLSRRLVAADVNADGKVDLIGANHDERSISIFKNAITAGPELYLASDAVNSLATVGATIQLKALAFHADVQAVEVFEDGRSLGVSDGSLTVAHRPESIGLHAYTARATGNNGIVSGPLGIRVVASETALGKVARLGTGVFSRASFLIYENGDVFGIGSNANGELADPFIENIRSSFTKIPSPSTGGNWREIAGGSGYAVGLTSEGRVFSWGINSQGQLGRDVLITTNTAPGEVILAGAGAVKKVVAGANMTLAIDENGSLFGWGVNNYGQLGLGFLSDPLRPQRLANPEGAAVWTDVSAGISHCLGLASDGKLYAWGTGPYLGLGETNEALVPTVVALPAGETAWTNMATTSTISIGQTASGKTYVWGKNYYDSLGLGDFPEPYVSFTTPVLQPGPGFKILAPGVQIHSAIGHDGGLYVWGGSIFGVVGLAETNRAPIPTRVEAPVVSKWVAVSMGGQRGLALAEDGRAYAWGFDFYNALGIGKSSAAIPTLVCSPITNCGSNDAPFVKITRPYVNELFPEDGIFRLQVLTTDFDGIVEELRIFQTEQVSFTLSTNVEVGRMGFGQTNLVLNLRAGRTSLRAVAYDNMGLATTSEVFTVTLRSTNFGQSIRFAKTNLTNAFTGWQEVFSSFFNNQTYRYNGATVILSNVPPGLTIRYAQPQGSGVWVIPYKFPVASMESVSFRFEFQCADDFTEAMVSAYYLPGSFSPEPARGEPQKFATSILPNGQFGIEFEHAAGEKHNVLISTDLIQWTPIPVPTDAESPRGRWSDGGPPITPKHPRQAPRRFYRLLKEP